MEGFNASPVAPWEMVETRELGHCVAEIIKGVIWASEVWGPRQVYRAATGCRPERMEEGSVRGNIGPLGVGHALRRIMECGG